MMQLSISLLRFQDVLDIYLIKHGLGKFIAENNIGIA